MKRGFNKFSWANLKSYMLRNFISFSVLIHKRKFAIKCQIFIFESGLLKNRAIQKVKKWFLDAKISYTCGAENNFSKKKRGTCNINPDPYSNSKPNKFHWGNGIFLIHLLRKKGIEETVNGPHWNSPNLKFTYIYIIWKYVSIDYAYSNIIY